MSIYDYENATRYLNIAQTMFNAIGSATKYSGCLRVLRECHERCGRRDRAALCTDKINELEGMVMIGMIGMMMMISVEVIRHYDSMIGELKCKIDLMNEKISNYKTRLINPVAEIEFIVQIERSTFRAMELHNIIKRKAVELELNEQELNVLQSDEIDMKVAQLNSISQELMIALESDEKELWSELVHDQPQIVEIEELKVRLQARLENETKILSQLEEEKRVKMIHI